MVNDKCYGACETEKGYICQCKKGAEKRIIRTMEIFPLSQIPQQEQIEFALKDLREWMLGGYSFGWKIEKGIKSGEWVIYRW